jgi:transmembrane sensor
LAWLARLQRGLRESEGPELLGWLRRPAHRALITRAAAEWHGPEILAVLGTIFPLDPRLIEARQGRSPLAVAATVLICAVVTATPVVLINRYVPGKLWHQLPEGAWMEALGDIYVTDSAAARQIILSDGTRVDLNRGTRIAVAYAEHVRAVLVSKGEAIFTVARERHRPFHVHAAGRDFDTQSSIFDVRVAAAHRVDLLVLEGTVTAFPELPRRHMDEGSQDPGTSRGVAF